MPTPLRALFIEDSENDVILALKALERGGFAPRHARVETPDDLERKLEDGAWDIVISDHKTPKLDALDALSIVRRRGIRIPFLIVSGWMDEMTAIALLRAGVEDYVTKDSLLRLVPAVERALACEKMRRERAETTQALERQDNKLREADLRIKNHEARLVQAEKMASLGQLAAGIAHEIKNPLGYVISNLGTLGDYLKALVEVMKAYDAVFVALPENPSAEKLASILEDIEALRNETKFDFIMRDLPTLVQETQQGADRIHDLVQRIRIFVREDDRELMSFDVNECIETALKLTWHEIKYKCEVRKDLGSLPPIPCQPGRLSQVFMNLFMNAAQAIPQRGLISVSSRLASDHIRVTVSDNGIGIPEEHFTKLFSSFFTTKPPGTGTGLGLSIANQIVRDHGGEIKAESQAGLGTTFTIVLPVKSDR